MAGHTLKSRLWRWVPGAFVLGFALSLALFGGNGFATPDNVHAAVYQWAAQHPGQEVPVILTTHGDQASAGETVTAVGGKVEQNLDFISAIQAHVPASSLGALASSNDVSFVSLDAPLEMTSGPTVSAASATPPSTYPKSVTANDAWSKGITGSGVGVAVVDTGISPTTNADFTAADGTSRVVAQVAVNANAHTNADGYGHGTHVAGIVGGNGTADNGKYVGVAPKANLINVKISDDQGNSGIGDLIAGIAWIMTHRNDYNIRVVNLSLHSSVAQSYKTSPLDAAVEFMWKNGIFVVVASGNTGSGPGAMFFPPANDPFVMTTGAIDDKGTSSFGDDVPASWSSGGVTQDGFTKPELLTPGANIVSTSDPNSVLFQLGLAANKVVDGQYLTLSGTSMSAGVMSGVAALVAQAHPLWAPGQMKCTLVAKSRTLSGVNSNFRVPRTGDTINSSSPQCNSDAGIPPNYLVRGLPLLPIVGVVASVLSDPSPADAAAAVGLDLTAANLVPLASTDPTALPPVLSINTVDWNAINWTSIKWDSIKWDSVKWDSIKWDSVKWDSIKWDSIKWDSIKWDGIDFTLIRLDVIKWDAIKWDSIKWDSIKWDSIKWDSIKWDSIKWDSIKWDSVGFDSVSQDFGDTAAVAEASTEDLSATTTVVNDPTAIVTPDGAATVASPIAPLS